MSLQLSPSAPLSSSGTIGAYSDLSASGDLPFSAYYGSSGANTFLISFVVNTQQQETFTASVKDDFFRSGTYTPGPVFEILLSTANSTAGVANGWINGGAAGYYAYTLYRGTSSVVQTLSVNLAPAAYTLTLIPKGLGMGESNAQFQFDVQTVVNPTLAPVSGYGLTTYEKLMVFLQNLAPNVYTSIAAYVRGGGTLTGLNAELAADVTPGLANTAIHGIGVVTGGLIGALDPTVATGFGQLYRAATDTDKNTANLVMDQAQANSLRGVMNTIDEQGGQPPVQPQSTTGGVSTFRTPVTVGQPIPLDPAIAPDLIYTIGAGDPSFSSVILPAISQANTSYEIDTLVNGTWQTAGSATPLQEFVFNQPVSTFRVHDIDVEGLNPATDWLSEVSFNASGTFTGTIAAAESVACYGVGTLIQTSWGEVAIEEIRSGDLVITLSNGPQPVRWVGRRSYSRRFLAGNCNLLPVLIRKGALGEGLPRRDLYVSPQHAMFLDGMLFPARCLINGRTIVQQHDCRGIQYFHVELDQHDVILAENAPSETFLDDGNRGVFHNAAEFAMLNLDLHVPSWFCAPRVESGYQLEALRNRLAIIASETVLAA